MIGSVATIPNFHQVGPALYRGAKPDAAGIAVLRGFGIRAIVAQEIFNLFEWLFAKRAGLAYQHISCKPWHPEYEDAIAFLNLAADPARQPMYVHCRQGADRTGMMVAIYRMVLQGWPRAAAIDEMVNGGFGFHGTTWPRIVPFLQGLDLQLLFRAFVVPPSMRI